MTTKPPTSAPKTPARHAARRIPMAELLKFLSIPLVATLITLVVLRRPARSDTATPAGGTRHIALVRKDAHFRPIPRERGGAAGSLSYGARGPDLSLQIRAEGLVPGRKYRFDLGVDGVTYSLASRAAAPDGTWSLDTTLTAFAEGACVGRNFQPERPLAGTHALSFAIKNDGSPPTGTLADQAPPDGGGAQLPCAGNGDGNYGYVLYEAEPGRFEGTASR